MKAKLMAMIFGLSFLTAGVSAQTWVQLPVNGNQFSSPPTWPAERGYNRLVYDPVLNKHYYMAAQNLCNVYTNALWAWDFATNTFHMKTWSGSFPTKNQCGALLMAADTPTYPGDRHPYATETYDTTRSRFVIYSGLEAGITCSGGAQGVCGFKDMYHYFSQTTPSPTGQGWVLDCNPCNPGTRQESAMEYEATDDLIVMYGGLQTGTATSDTWVFSGTTSSWTKIKTSCSGAGCVTNACGLGCNSLGQRAGEMLTFDPVNHKIVLYGGYIIVNGKPNVPMGDTWIYDPVAGSWTNPSPVPSPPAVKYPAMAYDSKRGLVWLHTGLGDPTGDDWTYNVTTNTWTHQSITGGPAPLHIPGYNYQNTMIMSYDPVQDALVATAYDGTQTPKMWTLSLANF